MSGRTLESLLMNNFKCFENLQVPFGKLTVLTGYNGSGKSTTFQPILLLFQAMEEFYKISKNPKELLTQNGQGRYWPLNGELVRLGTVGDVLNENADTNALAFRFEFSDGTEIVCDLVGKIGDGFLYRKGGEKSLWPLDFITQVSYIGADRDCASDIYPMPERHYYSKTGVGADGRFASYLYNKMYRKRKKFQSEFDRWLNFVLPGVRVQVQEVPNVSMFTLEFKMDGVSSFMKPENVSYGISHTFPIIVALLASAKNDLLIIDRPESHLHPQAQSRMGHMIAQFAKKNVQIIVETHSDHVLNGVRLAVMESIIEPENVSLLFYSGVEDDSHGVISPCIDPRGYLSEWPPGFFDQIDIDTAKLIGFDK